MPEARALHGESDVGKSRLLASEAEIGSAAIIRAIRIERNRFTRSVKARRAIASRSTSGRILEMQLHLRGWDSMENKT